MKYLLTIFLFCVSITFAFSQIDTWIEQLKTTEGKAKVDLLNKIGEAYTIESEGSSAKTYLEQAIPLAKSLKYKDGLAVAYYFMSEAHSLQSDLRTAKKYLCRWYKIRKRQGDKTKWGWALNGMARFYAAQLNDKKTEKYYKKLLELRRQQKNAYGEVIVLRSLASYYHYGPYVGSKRTLNIKKATYYYETLIRRLRAQYSKEEAPISEVDFYFKSLIDEAIAKKEYAKADNYAVQWFAFVKKLDGDFQSYIRIRQVARAYFEIPEFAKTTQYIEKAVNLSKATGTDKQKLRALRHGCFMMRQTKNYLKALDYAIDTWKVEKSQGKVNEWYTFSTLNAVIAKIYYTSDTTMKAAASQKLAAWKTILHEDADRKPLKWVNENIELLKL